MEILISGLDSEYKESLSFKNFDNFLETFKKISLIKGPLEAKIFVINDSLSSHQLSKFKNIFDQINIFPIRIYSNNRETILAGKSIKIDSNFLNEKDIKNKLLFFNSKRREDIFHTGTVRSGDRISSNGNLCIVGDVNPGAIISAKNNVYVWGKLLGIAFAGRGGNNHSSIASLYLQPLQLRIADIIAIGPKDKPKNSYPEIAVVENQTIIIKPYIIDTKN